MRNKNTYTDNTSDNKKCPAPHKNSQKKLHTSASAPNHYRVTLESSRTKYHDLRDTTVKQLSQFPTVYAEHRNRGFAGELLTTAEFRTITGQNVAYVEPDDDEEQYDPDINDTMLDSVRKQREAAWDDQLICIATRRGALHGVNENFRDAIDSRYYEELDKNVTIKDFFDHLNDV